MDNSERKRKREREINEQSFAGVHLGGGGGWGHSPPLEINVVSINLIFIVYQGTQHRPPAPPPEIPQHLFAPPCTKILNAPLF